MVTAPVEAEDVARIKLNGLKIMNRTVFPTAEDVWMVKASVYPRTVEITVYNLTALCDEEQLKNLLQKPEFVEYQGAVERLQVFTDIGPF